MTDIKQKALALVKRFYPECSEDYRGRRFQIAMAAIEQHEATKQELKAIDQEYSDFRQSVSDAVVACHSPQTLARGFATLKSFIIPAAKPDPLVELMERCSGADAKEGETWEEAMARSFRAALDACGLKIVEVDSDG